MGLAIGGIAAAIPAQRWGAVGQKTTGQAFDAVPVSGLAADDVLEITLLMRQTANDASINTYRVTINDGAAKTFDVSVDNTSATAVDMAVFIIGNGQQIARQVSNNGTSRSLDSTTALTMASITSVQVSNVAAGGSGVLKGFSISVMKEY